MQHKLSLRVPETDAARLDALAERLPLRRPDLARRAIQLGLDAIEADPHVLLADPQTTKDQPRAAG